MDDRSSTAILIGPGVTIVADLDSVHVDAYWNAVRETLRTVFGEEDAGTVVASARERLERAAAETQQIFYHASPFQVASDLVGVTETGLSGRKLSSYREIIAALDPAFYPPPP